MYYFTVVVRYGDVDSSEHIVEVRRNVALERLSGHWKSILKHHRQKRSPIVTSLVDPAKVANIQISECK